MRVTADDLGLVEWGVEVKTVQSLCTNLTQIPPLRLLEVSSNTTLEIVAHAYYATISTVVFKLRPFKVIYGHLSIYNQILENSTLL